MRTINLPPYAPTLIESTRAIGYSLEAAVADIIDNSIAADAAIIDIGFFPIDEEYITILDNGKGMNEKELDIAMQYGSKNPSELRDAKDLGRFGLGLKTASLSQCKCLTVVTKQKDNIYARRWDVDHVIETGDWSLLVLMPEEITELPQYDRLLENENGTLVVWQKLDRLKSGEIKFESSLGRKIDSVREHIALVYHRYLSGESGLRHLKICINNNPVLPADPFLIKKSTKPMDDETIIIRGEKIIVKAFILPHISKMTSDEIKQLGGKDGLRRQQGFYIYRNKRLLVWGTWFRMMRQSDLSKLARIQVDIPNTLDDLWTLDIKKSSAIPPVEVKNALEAIIQNIAEKSKRTWTFRGKKEINDTSVHLWNRMKEPQGGVYYEINQDHPLIKNLYKNDDKLRRQLNIVFRQIEHALPLNQLYVDLNNDEKMFNDHDEDEYEIIDTIYSLLETCSNVDDKLLLLDNIMLIEPFSLHKHLVERIKKEITNNELAKC